MTEKKRPSFLVFVQLFVRRGLADAERKQTCTRFGLHYYSTGCASVGELYIPPRGQVKTDRLEGFTEGGKTGSVYTKSWYVPYSAFQKLILAVRSKVFSKLTSVCKLRVLLRSRVLRLLYGLMKDMVSYG